MNIDDNIFRVDLNGFNMNTIQWYSFEQVSFVALRDS